MKRIITTHTLTLLFLIYARAYALPSADFTGSSFQQQGGLYLWHAALFSFCSGRHRMRTQLCLFFSIRTTTQSSIAWT